MVTRFCTPLGDRADEGLRTKFFNSVRGICADGALLKTSTLLRQRSMPNVFIIIRDLAHMIRTSIKDPLARTGHFAKQNKDLFEDRKALM